MKLSLCLIVKNEERTLPRVLSNASVFADEIVIVDTGSTDGTVNIARAFTDNVYKYEWKDDFAAARNYAIGKASGDYYMWLDADDVVPAATAKRLRSVLNRLDSSVDMVMLPYVIDTDEDGNPTYSYYRERIMKNRPEFYFRGRVHEAVPVSGNVIKLQLPIRHEKPRERSAGTRNLDIYTKMILSGEKLDPREKYYYARELFYHGRHDDAAKMFIEFLSGKDGFVPNKIDACIMLSRCYSRQNLTEEALDALFHSFVYGLPTGEAATEIGLTYFSKSDYKRAAYWFEVAASAKPDMESGAFVDINYYGFLPNVWLTVCYDRLGDIKRAYRAHRRAERLRPNHPSIIANRKYFESLNELRTNDKHKKAN